MTLYNDELLHYGVKGMRWGRRKSEESSSGDRVGFKQKVKDRDDKINEARSRKKEEIAAATSNPVARYAKVRVSELNRQRKFKNMTSKELATYGLAIGVLSMQYNRLR